MKESKSQKSLQTLVTAAMMLALGLALPFFTDRKSVV